MYTLYSKNGSCSMAVHVLLNELGENVKLEPYQIHGKTNPELAKINPRGNVPVIQKGSFHMREGGAILTWLCDEHDSELLPESGDARANALQWLMFANATLHPAYGRVFFLKSQQAGDELLSHATEMIQTLWDEVEAQLDGQDFICGDQMSVADILITVIANWSGYLELDIHYGTKCQAYFKRISERPAFQAALRDEAIEYQIAA